MQTATKNGFSGMIRMMVGFAPDGEVVNIDVLEQNETPGLGTKMADEDNPLLGSIRGKRLETMRLVDGRLAVVKDGGDVDALTAATISSRAYCDAVNRAWMAYRSVATGTVPTDVASGATVQTGDRTDAASAAARAAGNSTEPTDTVSGATVRTLLRAPRLRPAKMRIMRTKHRALRTGRRTAWRTAEAVSATVQMSGTGRRGAVS